MDLLEKLKHDADRIGNPIAAADYIRMIEDQRHQAARMDAQVDAMMKCKWGENYQPPERDDDSMQIIMNSVVADKETLLALQQQKGDQGTGEQTPPDPMPYPPSSPPASRPPLAKRILPWLALLLLFVLTSAVSYLALSHLTRQRYRYEFIEDDAATVQPADPSISG